MSPELKPCALLSIDCIKCGWKSGLYCDKDRLIEAWNTRAPDPRLKLWPEIKEIIKEGTEYDHDWTSVCERLLAKMDAAEKGEL